MRVRFAFLALFFAAGTLATAAAAREPSGSIVSFGRYETRIAGQPEKAERTASGVVQTVDSHKLLEQTDLIVGQPGNTFGIELRFENFPTGTAALTIRTTHPPLTNPKTGKTTTVSEYDWTSATAENTYFCFSFDDGWEIAEGVWTMQVLHEGKVIAEKKFKIVVPIN
jgi:hypothetical protein